MEIFVQKQLINIAYSFILGLIFGGIYDIIRIVHILCGIASYTGESRGMKRGIVPFLLFFLLDAAYMLITTCVFSVFLYAVNNGGFRLYLLAAVICGMVLYFITVGRIVMLLSETIVRFLRKVFTLFVLKPFGFILKLFRRLICWIGAHTIGKIVRYLQHRRAIRYTEKLKRRLRLDIRFCADHGKGRDCESNT